MGGMLHDPSWVEDAPSRVKKSQYCEQGEKLEIVLEKPARFLDF